MKKLHALTALVALLGLCLFAIGCGKDAAKPAAEAPAKVEKKAEATPAADKAGAEKKAAADKAAAEKAEAAEAAKKIAAKPVSEDKKKEKLAAAYADIYCAQITGKPEDVLAAYKRHGYENIDDWTRAWRGLSRDIEWVKQVMTDAKKACP